MELGPPFSFSTERRAQSSFGTSPVLSPFGSSTGTAFQPDPIHRSKQGRVAEYSKVLLILDKNLHVVICFKGNFMLGQISFKANKQYKADRIRVKRKKVRDQCNNVS